MKQPGKKSLRSTNSSLNTNSNPFGIILFILNSVVREHGEMSLSRFKFIWHMEWGHRQWGRLIGAAYALPAAIFWYKGFFNSAMKKRVISCGVLIGFQVC